ncbi:MAG: hypothetical protein ACYCYP_12595, partial [Leptospirales bacterium]
MSLEEWIEKTPTSPRGFGFAIYEEEIRFLFERGASRYEILRFLQEEKGCLLSYQALRFWMDRNGMNFKGPKQSKFLKYMEEIRTLSEKGYTQKEIF